ncbi:MAG: ABC transporter ATP-binding protein [Anaerolineae bacterium]|nr:ABC transporter ATP-binding protein [Anaerolineae bacterium]
MYGGSWWSYIYRAEDGQKAAPITWGLLRRVASYGRPYSRQIAFLLAAIILSTALSMGVPLVLRELIDNALPNQDVPLLNALAFILFLIPILNTLVLVYQRWLNSSIGEGVIYDLRRELYNHFQRMALRFYVNTKTGEIMSRLNNDVVGAQRAINTTFVSVITNLVSVFGVLVVMLSLEWRLTLAGIVILPLVILPARRLGNRLRVIIRDGMEQNARMNALMNETLNVNGMLLSKLFGRSYDEKRRFGERAEAVRNTGVRQAVLGNAFFTSLGLIGAFGTAVVYWLGGHMVLTGAISIGTLVAFAALLANLYGPLQALINAPVELVSSLVSFERVFEVLDLPVEIQEKPDAVPLREVQGRIAFEDLSFSYIISRAGGLSAVDRWGELDDAPTVVGAISQARSQAIDHLNFTIEPGQLVALVGPSGAGKTTLTYLLPRLYDPTSGTIRLDGHDLRDLRLADLAQHIGMVTQETFLFHDTIANNLHYAKEDATLEEMIAATRAANIYDFIQELPEGFETIVGERGYRLSGGEKQRLAIARILLKNPRILVLDEATSSLDSESEALIQNALEKAMAGRTSIVIAHRLSTILSADVILVMNRGQLVEHGTHESLLAQGGLYASLYETQFRAERTRAAEALA